MCTFRAFEICDAGTVTIGCFSSQGEERATIIAHSYGTLIASSLAKRHAGLVTAGLTLVDPICFAMFLPHLVRKTLHFEATGKLGGSAATVASASAAVLEGAAQGKGLFSRWLPIKGLMKGEALRYGLAYRYCL